MSHEPDAQQRGSFSQGVGQWIGAAEVYDAAGNFAGHGRDTRTVQADDGAGRVTVDVSFEGPFSMAGTYTIADHGTHRIYEGPLNHGYADVLGDGLVAAHNYWPQLGLTQRFFLMVLPDGTRQLSLALLSRGERLQWAVVGEYLRQTDPTQAVPPDAQPIDVDAVAGDPTAGRGVSLLTRPGAWSGTMTVVPVGTSGAKGGAGEQHELRERYETSGTTLHYQVDGGSNPTTFDLETDGWSYWTGAGDVVGAGSLFGGRGSSTQIHRPGDERRLWRREVASLDGTCKAVVNTWYRGEGLVGVSYGVLGYTAP